MIKAISLIKRKDGTTREQFRDYYENVHAPLMASLLPMISSYTRGYPDIANARLAEGVSEAPFDAFTTVTFDNEDDYQEYLRTLADPEVRARIRQDELNLVEPQAIYRFILDERTSYPKKDAKSG